MHFWSGEYRRKLELFFSPSPSVSKGMANEITFAILSRLRGILSMPPQRLRRLNAQAHLCLCNISSVHVHNSFCLEYVLVRRGGGGGITRVGHLISNKSSRTRSEISLSRLTGAPSDPTGVAISLHLPVHTRSRNWNFIYIHVVCMCINCWKLFVGK